jgi:TRAP-type C4-dicarboxylate transport system permease small subunit
VADSSQNLLNNNIMNLLNNLININNNFVTFFKYIASVLLVFIGLLIFLDIILREFFNRTIIGVPEIVANAVVIIAFMQFAYSISVKGMLRSDLLINVMPKSI